MHLHHFLRMARWARHPPSARRVKLVLGVLLACAVLLLIERTIGWPDFLSADTPANGRIMR